MDNYIKEIKSSLILITLIALCIGLVYSVSKYLDIRFFYGFIVYIILLCIVIIAEKVTKKQNKLLNKIKDLLSTPISVTYILLTAVFPIFSIITSILLYSGICITLPHLFFLSFEYFQINWPQNPDTRFYITLTTSVFLAVLFNNQIQRLIFWLMIKLRNDEKPDAFKIDELIGYIISAKNIRFIIYSFYVILLFTINYLSFETIWFSGSDTKDKAILQSFVTFIAFDRALTLLKDLKFKPSDFLRMIVRSFLNKWENLEAERNKNK